MRSSTTLALLFALSAASLLAVSSASANSVPTRTRSDYGASPSTVESGPVSFSAGGLTIGGLSFCADNSISPGNPTCNLSLDYQIESALPAGTTSLTVTVPVPSGTSLIDFGIMTNGDSFSGDPIFFSPFSQSDILGLPNGAITFGTDGSGNPFITINDPLTNLPGGGNGLALFYDLSDNSS